jgi:hypothetical protein
LPIGPDSVEYTALGNEGPFGRGTRGDPYRLLATHRLVGSGADLDLLQTVSYVDGENRFRLEWQVTNEGSQQTCFRFYHAADLYFADSDFGYGFYDSGSGAVGGFNERRDWFMVFIPTVPADHFREAHFGSIWFDINSAADFNDTISSDYEDNGAGLQWDVCLSPGQATTLGDLWSFGTSESEAVSSVSGGFRATGPLASELTTHIPTPLDVSLDPGVIGTNLLLAALATVAFVSASGVLTKLLGEHQEEARKFPPVRWVAGLQKAIGSAFGDRLSRLSAVGVVKLIGIVLFYGFVFSLLDRTWSPFSLAGIWLFVSMTIAYGVVGIAADIVQWAAARRWGVPADLILRPTSVLLAIFSTAASRLFGLIPGLMFGTPEAFDVGPQALDRKRERRLLIVAAGTLLMIGACAWLPTVVTAFVQRARLPDLILALVGGVESLLLVVFAVTVENGFVQMLPLPGNVGQAFRRWNRWLWLASLGAVLFLFFHLLMNPTGNLASALREANVVFFILTVIVFSLGVGALWLYFKLARGRAPLPIGMGSPAPAPAVGESVLEIPAAQVGAPAEAAPEAGFPGGAPAAPLSPAPQIPGVSEGPTPVETLELSRPGASSPGMEARGPEPGAQRAMARPAQRPPRKGLGISPLAFGLVGIAAALLVTFVCTACLVGVLIVTR